ncbi:MAG TPA: barstar family protein [Pseudonocardiaceae bacterium]|nr:barstar family protein [Pseudonocardiaceae bacterium]
MLRYVPDAARAIAEARDRGALVHLVGPVNSKADALDAIGVALNFPAWYGRNLDALYDCLVDLSWQGAGEHVLVWAGHRQFEVADPDGYRAVLAVLDDAAAASSERPLSVLLADA